MDRGEFVVTAGTLKLDPATMTGNAVEIEMREEAEVLDGPARDAVGDATVENPAFDVTPARYLDAIVTERGQFPPESIVALMREPFGEGSTDTDRCRLLPANVDPGVDADR